MIRVTSLIPLFASLLIFGNVYAQDFEVAPVRLDFEAEPGDNQSKIITIKNHGNKRASFIISLSDFLPTESGERKVLAPNSTKRSCANWMNINPSFFELNPGEDAQVQVSILVPNDEYGAAWCQLYFQTTVEQTSWSADKKLGAGMIVSGRIGVLIYQSPKSNQNHSVKISSLKEIASSIDIPRKFTATVENLGEKVTTCKVYLIASNMQTAEEVQFKPIEVETFPKMSRNVELTLPSELQAGKYALAAILDYGSKFSLEGTQIIIDVKGTAEVKPGAVP